MRPYFLAALLPVILVACSSAPDDSSSSTEQGIANPLPTTTPTILKPPPPPCWEHVPPTGCHTRPITPDPNDPLIHVYGCDAPFKYFWAGEAGRGTLYLCPDTPALKAYVDGKGAEMPGLCNVCVPPAPFGKIYVWFRGQWTGPTCQSGCAPFG